MFYLQRCQCHGLHSTTVNFRLNDELERMWKKIIVLCFKVICGYLPEVTKDRYKYPSQRYQTEIITWYAPSLCQKSLSRGQVTLFNVMYWPWLLNLKPCCLSTKIQGVSPRRCCEFSWVTSSRPIQTNVTHPELISRRSNWLGQGRALQRCLGWAVHQLPCRSNQFLCLNPTPSSLMDHNSWAILLQTGA